MARAGRRRCSGQAHAPSRTAGEYHLKEICGYAAKHGFTHLMVLNEARKAANM